MEKLCLSQAQESPVLRNQKFRARVAFGNVGTSSHFFPLNFDSWTFYLWLSVSSPLIYLQQVSGPAFLSSLPLDPFLVPPQPQLYIPQMFQNKTSNKQTKIGCIVATQVIKEPDERIILRRGLPSALDSRKLEKLSPRNQGDTDCHREMSFATSQHSRTPSPQDQLLFHERSVASPFLSPHTVPCVL